MHKLYSVTLNSKVITKELVTLAQAKIFSTKHVGDSNDTIAIRLELEFLIGKKIRLLKMNDDPDPIPVGSLGTVYHVSGKNTSMCQICVAWEINRTLNLCFPQDEFEIIYV